MSTAAPLFIRPTIDWKNPNFMAIMDWRIRVLGYLRSNPDVLAACRLHYGAHPVDFINDWGVTVDPRLIARGLPAQVPFVLFPRQREWINWTLERWRNREPGLTEKSRDSGLSWLVMALSCTLTLFNNSLTVGIGSRKELQIDSLGDSSSLFEKARIFLSNVPIEFRGGWLREKHAPYMRILIPATGGVIAGEAGDQIGRGARSSIYFVDEAAFLERPELVDRSLSATTDCRIDVSTPNGPATSFAEKIRAGRIPRFQFHWRDDPRKDQAWYEKQLRELDPVTIAQEIDISHSASVEGIVIPSSWVQSAVDAHVKLRLAPSGLRFGALDVADQGVDRNAFASRYGFLLEHLESWSGKGGDIYDTVVRAFDLCDQRKITVIHYDADGLGAGVRGDARIINERRAADGRTYIHDDGFRGSAAPDGPESQMVPGRKNKDFFANLKAQSWWALRLRFQNVHRWVTQGVAPQDPDDIISIPSTLPELNALLLELSQPTYRLNSSGKILIDKAPDGTRSPNLADAVMIAFGVGMVLETWMKLGKQV